MNFTVIIPARYASTRFPGKPLANILGKPMILQVMQQAARSGASRVVVATDSLMIKKVVESAGGETCMTSTRHQSGTERVAEVVSKYSIPDNDIVVNLQGDEPFISSNSIRDVVGKLIQSCASIATIATPITHIEELINSNTVKVVIDYSGYALYFSRASIPFDRNHQYPLSDKETGTQWLHHHGVYAYRVSFLHRYINWKKCRLEEIESLEQLRVLWYGHKISVAVTEEELLAGIDTPNQLISVNRLITTK